MCCRCTHKVRDIKFFDRTVLNERIVWLPFGHRPPGSNGHDVDSRMNEPEGRRTSSTAGRSGRGWTRSPKPAKKPSPNGRWSEAARSGALARTKVVRKLFGNAWVLMDRIMNADDSAEHLFRYLRQHRRNVNAWFVIEKGTPDYKRLRKDGYLRVVPHGSLAWKLLMLNARHLISSHIDHPIVRPHEIVRARAAAAGGSPSSSTA